MFNVTRLMLVITCLYLMGTAAAFNIHQNFQNGIKTMMNFYVPNKYLWQDSNCIASGGCTTDGNHGFWYWANAEYLLADYLYITHDKQYIKIMPQILAHNKSYIFHAAYFDDEGWWIMAAINAYRETHDKFYLVTAEQIMANINQRGLQDICGGSGGIYWDAKKTQVGSIANQLYIRNNAQLYLITHKKQYFQDANKTWLWFQHSGLMDKDFNLADHYSVEHNQCGAKNDWHFTYTTGVLLGMLVDLSHMYQDPQLLHVAQHVAQIAMSNYSLGGILTETCTNVNICADDGFMFKGIFVHELAYVAVNSHNKPFMHKVRKYLLANYIQLMNNQGQSRMYAFSWSLPVESNAATPVYNPVDIVSNMSGLYLLDAMLMLDNVSHTHMPHRFHFLRLKHVSHTHIFR